MDSLSSSFLPTISQLKVSSMTIQNQPPTKDIFAIHHRFNTFHEPLMKLISNTSERIKSTINTNRTIDHNKTKQSLLASTFKSIDDFICDYMDSPLRPSVDPRVVLSTGNLAPVDELPPAACEVVEGSLPSCLDGVYLLNGPNPQFPPRGPYHLFDGDGMIHAIKIDGGKATFCSRFVETYKYVLERDMGYNVIPSPFSSFNGILASLGRVGLSVPRVVAGEFDPLVNGYGTANTSLAVIGVKLYALGESDLPYERKVTPDGDIITLGRHDFHSIDEFLSMTAHPKFDLETGEAFAFRYDLSHPRLRFFRIDSHGKKQPDVPIFSIKDTTIIHDFAMTKNYAIFNDVQMVISPFEILKGKPPMRVDRGKTPRIGVINKYAKDESEMWWVDVQGLNISHVVNAWEEDDDDTLLLVAANSTTVEKILERLDLAEMKMEEIRISVERKRVLSRRLLSDRLVDMPCIHRSYVGKKNRYAYAVVVAPTMKPVGLVKIDLSLSSDDCVVASRMYERSCTGNEPFFVPREPNNPNADEDDGFILVYVHDESSKESKFLVMDAKSPTLENVAVVMLPGRVPTGFHGLFVSEDQLKKLN